MTTAGDVARMAALSCGRHCIAGVVSEGLVRVLIVGGASRRERQRLRAELRGLLPLGTRFELHGRR